MHPISQAEIRQTCKNIDGFMRRTALKPAAADVTASPTRGWAYTAPFTRRLNQDDERSTRFAKSMDDPYTVPN